MKLVFTCQGDRAGRTLGIIGGWFAEGMQQVSMNQGSRDLR